MLYTLGPLLLGPCQNPATTSPLDEVQPLVTFLPYKLSLIPVFGVIGFEEEVLLRKCRNTSFNSCYPAPMFNNCNK
jgi:hypothetical protein